MAYGPTLSSVYRQVVFVYRWSLRQVGFKTVGRQYLHLMCEHLIYAICIHPLLGKVFTCYSLVSDEQNDKPPSPKEGEIDPLPDDWEMKEDGIDPSYDDDDDKVLYMCIISVLVVWHLLVSHYTFSAVLYSFLMCTVL